MSDTSRLAKRIRQAREMANMSQASLAHALGLTNKSISAYEQGRAVPPFKKLQKLASVTGQAMQYFVEDNIDDAIITTKLRGIEKDLEAIKKILNKKD